MRKVIKDKKTGLAKKYLSGIKGEKRTKLANVIKKMANLRKAGKKIPKSLIDKRIKLGSKSKKTKRSNY
jgi:hypothetical protein